MEIRIDDLDESGTQFNHTYELNALSLEDENVRLISPSNISGRIRRKGNHVDLDGVITTRIEIDCHRCLVPAEQRIEVSFETTFVRAADMDSEAENVELQEEDLGLSDFDGEAINIDGLVREQILLELPIRLLCRDDCRGLCSHCGADLNAEDCVCEQIEMDPRWGSLAQLKKV